jgi:hypothetical protein
MNEATDQTVFSVQLTPTGLPKGEYEYRAFLRLLPDLLKTHRGQYVAVHEGRVIDRDADEVTLILRVQSRLGYVPLFVGLVTEPQPVVRVPHYREYRPQEGT